MDPHSPGAPASERTKGTPFKRLTTWLGITEENHHGPPHSAQSGVPSGAPYLLGPDGKFHEVIRIDRSGRPISTPNYNELNTGYAGPPPASVRSVPAYPQQQPLFDPQIRRDYPYHGGPPHGMVTPASPSAEIPQGIQQLRAELQAAEAQFNNGRTLFATHSPLSGAFVNVAEDDFAEFSDSVARDSSLHSPVGSIILLLRRLLLSTLLGPATRGPKSIMGSYPPSNSLLITQHWIFITWSMVSIIQQ